MSNKHFKNNVLSCFKTIIFLLLIQFSFFFFITILQTKVYIYIYILLMLLCLIHQPLATIKPANLLPCIHACCTMNESLLNGCGPSCLSWVLTWPSPAFHMNANFLWRVGKSMNKNDIVSSFHHSLDIAPTFDQSPPDDSMPSVRHCRSSRSHNINPFFYLVGNIEYIIFFIKKLFLYSN